MITINVAMSLYRTTKFIAQRTFLNCEVFIRRTNCSNFHWSIASYNDKRQTTWMHSRFYNFYGTCTLKIFIVLNTPHRLIFIIIILVIAADSEISYHDIPELTHPISNCYNYLQLISTWHLIISRWLVQTHPHSLWSVQYGSITQIICHFASHTQPPRQPGPSHLLTIPTTSTACAVEAVLTHLNLSQLGSPSWRLLVFEALHCCPSTTGTSQMKKPAKKQLAA